MNAPDAGAERGLAAAPGPGHDPAGWTRMHQLADEQAALRRVATLVARSAGPAEVFAAIADALAQLIGAEAGFGARVETGGSRASPPGSGPAGDGPPGEAAQIAGTCEVVASYGRTRDVVPAGFRFPLAPGTSTATALATGRPAMVTGEQLARTPFGELTAGLGLRAAVAAPIVVEGRYWGVTLAATIRGDFPPGTGTRLADFTELAATAIANAQAEQQLRELAGTQEALRRLAMLVARGEPPEAVFSAVAREALRYFTSGTGNGTARMIRYELDGTATLVSNHGTTGPHVQVGKRWDGYPVEGLTATVWRTGKPARVEDYRTLPGGEPYAAEGLRSAVGMPILVNGRLWGLLAAGSRELLPEGAEQRMMDFTDLVATAIANAQSRAELISSRARIVTASDEARRRIERDLHDGAQQRLVTLALQLRAAAAAAPAGCEAARAEIADVAAGLVNVVDELREIARGLHPAILNEAGLRPALRALGRRSAVPAEMDLRIDGRLPEPVEVAAYYVVSEMLTNAAKHANASVVEVRAEVSGGSLRLRVADDGAGGADPARGSGLVGLKDRVEALGGRFSVHSPPGGGTAVTAELPLAGSSPGLVGPGPPR